MHSLRTVGMESRLHDFDGERIMISRASSSIHARKFESDVPAVSSDSSTVSIEPRP